MSRVRIPSPAPKSSPSNRHDDWGFGEVILFLACWREIGPIGSKNRGWVSLMRRNRYNLKPEQQRRLSACHAEWPALDLINRFKQGLCYLLLKKHKTKKQCPKLIPSFLRAVVELRWSGLAQLVALGDTLHSWPDEIARVSPVR